MSIKVPRSPLLLDAVEVWAFSSGAAHSVNVSAMMPAGSVPSAMSFAETLSHHLGSARARGGDDLQMRAAMADRRQRVTERTGAIITESPVTPGG